ncbi:hypothetical protein EDB19DRAFT_582936 [Suillus lakei]|nr:hypothetical protein EDB19DRAFT_582936 [Suillus lakei]
MTNWQDPQVIYNWSVAFADITFLMLGLFGWSYLHSCQVENALLRRQLSFRWQMVSYLTGRTLLFVTLILSAVTSLGAPPYLYCHQILKFLAFSRNIVIACTSTNLAIRTWTIWKTNYFVCVFLGLITLGHWFTLMLDSTETQFSTSLSSGFCESTIVDLTYSPATSTYTTILIFVLVKLKIFGHWRSSSCSLWTIIRTQGVIYFFIAFFASVVPLVFAWLNLNYIMNVFFICPATCIMYDSLPHPLLY